MLRPVVIAYERGYRMSLTGQLTNPEGKILQGSRNGRYRYFNIRIEGRARHVQCGHLQAYQKFGDAVFEAGTVVRHLDDDGDNNTWGNIEIGTQSDNMADIPYGVRSAIGKRNARRKLTDDQVTDVRKRLLQGDSPDELAQAYGVSANHIKHIQKGLAHAPNIIVDCELDRTQYHHIRAQYSAGFEVEELAELHELNKAFINQILTGKRVPG